MRMALNVVFTVKEVGKDYIVIEAPDLLPLRFSFKPLEKAVITTPIGTEIHLTIPLDVEDRV
jgi:hypothetical protein